MNLIKRAWQWTGVRQFEMMVRGGFLWRWFGGVSAVWILFSLAAVCFYRSGLRDFIFDYLYGGPFCERKSGFGQRLVVCKRTLFSDVVGMVLFPSGLYIRFVEMLLCIDRGIAQVRLRDVFGAPVQSMLVLAFAVHFFAAVDFLRMCMVRLIARLCRRSPFVRNPSVTAAPVGVRDSSSIRAVMSSQPCERCGQAEQPMLNAVSSFSGRAPASSRTTARKCGLKG